LGAGGTINTQVSDNMVRFFFFFGYVMPCNWRRKIYNAGNKKKRIDHNQSGNPCLMNSGIWLL
jgi:hypothetical protein